MGARSGVEKTFRVETCVREREGKKITPPGKSLPDSFFSDSTIWFIYNGDLIERDFAPTCISPASRRDRGADYDRRAKRIIGARRRCIIERLTPPPSESADVILIYETNDPVSDCDVCTKEISRKKKLLWEVIQFFEVRLG